MEKNFCSETVEDDKENLDFTIQYRVFNLFVAIIGFFVKFSILSKIFLVSLGYLGDFLIAFAILIIESVLIFGMYILSYHINFRSFNNHQKSFFLVGTIYIAFHVIIKLLTI